MGRYIARNIISKGDIVVGLTNSVPKKLFPPDLIQVSPLCFDNPIRLTESLKGVDILYNTYWVRFNWITFSYEQAILNSIILFNAAKAAGVRRIVHVSITNPSEDSPFGYFRGKAQVERMLAEIGISYAILRPSVLFGDGGILINNIAWALRYLPVIGVFGDGQYRLQPIFVEDLANIAIEHGRTTGNRVIDAIGPETFSYRQLVCDIGNIIGKPRPVISVSPIIGLAVGKVIGGLKGDVMITKDEIYALMANLLYVDSSPVGTKSLTSWVTDRALSLGTSYLSELAIREKI